MARTGGRVNDNGKVSKGRMPKGHCDPFGEAGDVQGRPAAGLPEGTGVMAETPRCPKCGAPNPFGTHCQAKKPKK